MTHRLASEEDDEAIRSFECSTSRPCSREPEEFIRRSLPASARREDHIVVVFLRESRIIAIGAYRRGKLIIDADEDPDVVEVSVYALTRAFHGARLDNGSRLSDWCLRGLLLRALRDCKCSWAYALVDHTNAPSLALCDRVGLDTQTTVNAAVVRATGVFSIGSNA